jgi:hypothetical protein
MIKGTIRVHTIPSEKPLDTKGIARQIAQQLRKGNYTYDKRTEIQRGA